MRSITLLLISLCFSFSFIANAGTITVTNSNDNGPGSLRQAILDAAPLDVIHFDASTNSNIILLTSGKILINKHLTLVGNGIDNTIIDGDNTYRVIEISDLSGNIPQSYPIVRIEGMTIQNGYAVDPDAGPLSLNNYGGGIQALGTAVIKDCQILSCQAQFGGGIMSLGRAIGITNTRISGCDAEFGGGMMSDTAFINTSTIELNTSTRSHGGGIMANGKIILTNSTINNNHSAENGGGIHHEYYPLMIINCTFYENTADGNGGGLSLVPGGTTTLTSTTISGNGAVSGGGVYIDPTSTSLTLFNNSIIYGNTASSTDGPDGWGERADIDQNSSYNYVGDIDDFRMPTIFALQNKYEIDPVINPLADNGGLTKTMALLCGSPAINTGDPGLTSDDQRGEDVYGTRRDVGAFELQDDCECSLLVTSADDSGAGTLRYAVTCAQQGDTITFDASIDGIPIQLTRGMIHIKIPLTFIGNGMDNTIIEGSDTSQIFQISDYIYVQTGIPPFVYNEQVFLSYPRVHMEGMTLQHGNATFIAGWPNADDLFGGAIFNYGDLTISACRFNENAAYYGGAIGNSWLLDISNSIFTTNTAEAGGGVAHFSEHEISIFGSIFTGNQVTNQYSEGGAITSTIGKIILENTTISNNHSNYMGGGIGIYGAIDMLNCTVTGNTSGHFGGGASIYAYYPSTIINSTISGNISDTAGGVYLKGYQDSLLIQNSIIAGNTANIIGPEGTNEELIISPYSSHNLVSDNTELNMPAGNNNLIGVDPLLGTLADNGGINQTMALLDCSPAYNTGNDAIAPALDQRGQPRFGISDIGAFESQVDLFCISAIYGIKFEDLNANGLMEAGEQTMPGHEFNLTGTDIFGNSVDLTDISGPDGELAYTDLVPGYYELIETSHTDGMIPTNTVPYSTNLVGNVFEVAYNGQSGSPELESVIDGLKFGNTVYGSIHGAVFNDINGNGVFDDGAEHYFDGIEVEINGIEGSGLPYFSFYFTGPDGEFHFDELIAGEYTISYAMPNGYQATTPHTMTWMIQSREELVVYEGQAELPPDAPQIEVLIGDQLMFGLGLPVSDIHGYKFEDIHADAMYNASMDPGLEGVEFTLSGQDQFGNQVNLTAISDPDGRFSFIGVVAGDYILSENLPLGFIPTTSINGISILVQGNELFMPEPGWVLNDPVNPKQEIVNPFLNFGNTVPGSIHGLIFEDANGNGIFDPAFEVPATPQFAPFEIVLIDFYGSAIPTAVDPVSGEFHYTDLVPMPFYTVLFQLPFGYDETTPTGYQTPLLSREELVAYSGQAQLLPDDPRIEMLVGEGLMFGIIPEECLQDCPADIRIGSDQGACGANVFYEPPTVACHGATLELLSGFEPGAFFPLGVTTVIYQLTALNGEISTCSFEVEIYDNEPPELTCPPDITVNTDP
ncbi:MAG: HYR domain-containing protein, partial [Bacteroidetes bacterium]|nr:HYR domain-containing protein [Bacteroidota bacterium]